MGISSSRMSLFHQFALLVMGNHNNNDNNKHTNDDPSSQLKEDDASSSSTKLSKLDNSVDGWISETERTLVVSKNTDSSNLPRWLVQELLLLDDDATGGDEEEEEDCHRMETHLINNDNTKEDFLIKGVPQRPLYKELALRLFRWNQRIQQRQQRQQQQQQQSKATVTTTTNQEESSSSSPIPLLVPAEQINLEELDTATNWALSCTPPPCSVHELGPWFQQVDSFSILRLLGMRHTIGSHNDNDDDDNEGDSKMIPSRHRLLQACRAIHKPNRSKLTVAARARSKHAHRAGQALSYFGTATGPAEVQNEQTEAILQKLLADAIWINRHRFVGLQDGAVALEIRVLEGYGARWILDNNNNNSNNNSNSSTITFRGFLEPQMKDGHERKWRH